MSSFLVNPHHPIMLKFASFSYETVYSAFIAPQQHPLNKLSTFYFCRNVETCMLQYSDIFMGLGYHQSVDVANNLDSDVPKTQLPPALTFLEAPGGDPISDVGWWTRDGSTLIMPPPKKRKRFYGAKRRASPALNAHHNELKCLFCRNSILYESLPPVEYLQHLRMYRLAFKETKLLV